MSEKQSTGVKFRANGIMEKKWLDGNILQFTFLDHSVLRFDRRLASAGNRDNAERMGWQQRLGDLGAIEAEDFPDRMARSMEAKRKISRGVNHYQGPSSEWEIPAERAPSGPTADDVRAILERFKPGQGATLFKGLMAMHKDDVKAAATQILATAEMRQIWLDIQAERAAAATKNLPSADDMLAAMMAAAEADGDAPAE